jgi:hypothetical protein
MSADTSFEDCSLCDLYAYLQSFTLLDASDTELILAVRKCSLAAQRLGLIPPDLPIPGNEPSSWNPAGCRELLADLRRYAYERLHAQVSKRVAECDPLIEQYVTLDKMAAVVSRSKRTLEKRKNRRKNPLPPPDVEGGGGKPDEWLWARVRPWLEEEFGRTLPERFPQLRTPS